MSAGEWPVSVTAASCCDEEQPRATTVTSVRCYSLSNKELARALARRGKVIMIISRTYCGYGKKGKTMTTMASASRTIRRPAKSRATAAWPPRTPVPGAMPRLRYPVGGSRLPTTQRRMVVREGSARQGRGRRSVTRGLCHLEASHEVVWASWRISSHFANHTLPTPYSPHRRNA